MFGERAVKVCNPYHCSHHEVIYRQTLASKTKSGIFIVYHIMSPNLLSYPFSFSNVEAALHFPYYSEKTERFANMLLTSGYF